MISPTSIGKIINEYLHLKKIVNNTIKVIHRTIKSELTSSILKGIQNTIDEIIAVMNSNFSHLS